MSISVLLVIPTDCLSEFDDSFLEQFDSECKGSEFTHLEVFDVNPDNYDLDPDNILVVKKIPHDVTIESSDLGESGDTFTQQVRFDGKGNMVINKFKGRQQTVDLDALVAAYMTGDLHSLIQTEYGKIISWEDQLKIIESRKVAINEWLTTCKDNIEQALATLVPEVYEGEDSRTENLLNLYSKSADEQASFLVLNGCYPGKTTPYKHQSTLPTHTGSNNKTLNT